VFQTPRVQPVNVVAVVPLYVMTSESTYSVPLEGKPDVLLTVSVVADEVASELSHVTAVGDVSNAAVIASPQSATVNVAPVASICARTRSAFCDNFTPRSDRPVLRMRPSAAVVSIAARVTSSYGKPAICSRKLSLPLPVASVRVHVTTHLGHAF